MAAIVAGGPLTTDASAEEANIWNRFRGENGTGYSDLKGLPVEWTESDYEWQVRLPGKGHSSPVVWKDKLFVTCGMEDGSRILQCRNAITGDEVWSHTVALGANHLHLKNSYASGTPTTDGQLVYAAFADEKHYIVTAYDYAGEQVWTTDLGSFTSQHGQGVSPILYKNFVIVPNDQRGPSSIVALDRQTGDIIWQSAGRTAREASYSTPILLKDGNASQLICLSGGTGITALEPESGKLLWSSDPMPQRTVASLVEGDGVVMAFCGQGGRGKYMVAVEPAGDGSPAAKVRFERMKEIPYVPTPVTQGGVMYMWLDNGIVCCTNLKTGEDLWLERVGGKFSGSPVLVDGKLYCIAEDGTVVVVRASTEFELLGKSPLGDESYATPAIANGRMYLRGFQTLASLKSRAESAP